jgi:O-antigen/teichoic acid export membrane protein
MLLLPLAALTAGAAPEIVALIYGQAFVAAAPVLVVLVFGGVAAGMIYVSAVILIAAGRPGWVLGVSWCLPLLAMGGHLVLIPRLGLVGAAIVTTTVATLGALGAVAAVYRTWRIAPPMGTAVRGILIGVLAYGLVGWWSTPGLLLLVKLPVLIVLVASAFALLGEFSRGEMASATSLLLRRPLSGDELRGA